MYFNCVRQQFLTDLRTRAHFIGKLCIDLRKIILLSAIVCGENTLHKNIVTKLYFNLFAYCQSEYLYTLKNSYMQLKCYSNATTMTLDECLNLTDHLQQAHSFQGIRSSQVGDH